MANKRPKPEEIVTKLRQVEFLTGQGMPRLNAIRQIGVTEQTYDRWKKKYGGMGTEQLKELNRLQKENERLRRAIFDLTLDKLILAEAAKGNFYVPLVAAPALIVFVLRDAGWHVNDKRVERLWRREGLSDLFILRGVPLYIWS